MNLEKLIKEETIENILSDRDTYEIGSLQWDVLNRLKALVLEEKKPSTQEVILTYKEKDLENIPLGFSEVESLDLIDDLPKHSIKRSLAEYNSAYRHPIPYVIIKFKDEDKYFFTLREKGSGEARLIGKKGMLGGHVRYEDSINNMIFCNMFRELYEEAGITSDMICTHQLKGIIKSNDGVDSDHLGLIYEVVIDNDNIKSEEKGVLSGIWINKKDLSKHYESFESWSKIAYDNLLKD